jgi:hypothetical protein
MYIGSDCHLQNLPAKNTVNSKVFQSIKGKEDTAPYKTGTILTLQYMTLEKGGEGSLGKEMGCWCDHDSFKGQLLWHSFNFHLMWNPTPYRILLTDYAST